MKRIITVLLIAVLAYGEWRLWPRRMAVYHAKPVTQNPIETNNTFTGTSTFSGPVNWSAVTCTMGPADYVVTTAATTAVKP